MQVSRPVLIAAASAFVALVATVFFLLGRESVRRRPAIAAVAPAAVSEPAVAVVPSAQAAPPSVAAPASPTSPPVATPAPPAAPPIAPAAPPLPTTAPPPPPPARAAPSAAMTLGGGAPPPAPAADDTTAVRDYFTRIQAIQATAPSTDTNEFANKLLASSLGGDTSGLDELARVAEEGANRARAVTPPPACAACADYHQRLIGMLGESASMVKQLKSALTSKDPAALNALSATGSSLQARANALDDQARQIKAEYGLR